MPGSINSLEATASDSIGIPIRGDQVSIIKSLSTVVKNIAYGFFALKNTKMMVELSARSGKQSSQNRQKKGDVKSLYFDEKIRCRAARQKNCSKT